MKNKKLLWFSVIFFLCVSFSLFTSSLEYMDTADKILKEKYSIEIEPLSVSIDNRTLSIQKWWVNRPRIYPIFVNDTPFKTEINNILKKNGYVIDEMGKPVFFDIKEMSNTLVYIKAEYSGIKKDNSSDLFLKETFIIRTEEFISEILPPFSNDLPKLLILLTKQNIETISYPLFRSENAYVFLIENSEFSFIEDGKNELIHLDNSPITIVRIKSNLYELSILSEIKQNIKIDDTPYEAPIKLKLEEGIHVFEYNQERKYIYLEDNMEIELNIRNRSGSVDFSTSIPATLTISDKAGDLILEKYIDEKDSFTLKEGLYSYNAIAFGFKDLKGNFYVENNKRTIVKMEFKGLPGSIKIKKSTADRFDNILLNDERIILTKEDLSLIFDKRGKQLNIFEEKIKGCTADYYYSNYSIYDNSDGNVFNTQNSINKIADYEDSVLIFESNFMLSNYSETLDFINWNREIDFIPWKCLQSEDYLIILDMMSRLIILKVSTGFSKIFDERITGITNLDIEKITADYISINLYGIEKTLEYYFRNNRKRIKELPEQDYSGRKIRLSDNTFYDLSSIPDEIVDIYENDNLIGILTKYYFMIIYR